MCCRYWADDSPELRPIVEAMNRSPLLSRWEGAPVRTFGEVRPADVAPVIATDRRGNRAVFPMKWGFSGRSLLINARAETAAEKPTFREAWAAHRCVAPASWYYEWSHVDDGRGRRRADRRYAIRPADGALAWLCGLYRIESGLPVFVVLTRTPAESIRFIHDRMPLMLPASRVGDWIDPAADPAALAREAVTDLCFEQA